MFGAIGGCISWLVVVVWAVAFVQWMIGGEIDVISGILGLAIFIGLGMMAFDPPARELGFLAVIGIFGSIPAFPILRYVMHRHHARDSEIEAVRQAYEGFVFRPNNPPAQIRLARSLYRLGLRGHAHVLAEAALPQLPIRFFPDEHRMVQQWRHHPLPPSEFEPITCVECGHPNHPGTIHCAACGARYLLDRVRGRVLSSSLGRRLLAAWLVMLLVLGGIPFVSALPGTIAVVAVFALLLVACGTLVLAFRPVRGSSA